MKSKTKREFSEEVIRALVASQLGTLPQVQTIRPLTDGWFNTAYHIVFSNSHSDVILRIAPDPRLKLLTYEKDLMRSELEVYMMLASYPQIPIPKLIGYDFQRNVINHDYMLIEKLPGKPYSEIREKLSIEEKTNIEYQLGKIFRQVSSIKGERFGYLRNGPGYGAQTWSEGFGEMVETLLSDGERLSVVLPASHSQIREAIMEGLPALAAVETPVLVHWDLWPGNIFVANNGNGFNVTGIIDWERAFFGDAFSESPVAVGFYAQSFTDGWGIGSTQSANQEVRKCIYRLYLWLVMIVEDSVRFENAAHIGWVQDEFNKDFHKLIELLKKFG